MAPTAASQSATRLVSAFLMSGSDWNLLDIGRFARDLPTMLDSSPALTAAVECCITACDRKSGRVICDVQLEARQYGRALVAMRQALQNPRMRKETPTLFAVVLLQRLETIIAVGPLSFIPCWSVHAAGLSDLLQQRENDLRDEIIVETVLENLGPIAAHASARGVDCFLGERRWLEALFSHPSTTATDRLYIQIIQSLTQMPRLFRLAQAVRDGKESFETAWTLAISLRNQLHDVIEAIKGSRMLSDLYLNAVYDRDSGSPVKKVYIDVDIGDARLISWHHLVTMAVNNIMTMLSKIYGLSDLSPEVKRENSVLCHRIWMLHGLAEQAGPIKHHWYSGCLAVTFAEVESHTTRLWIVEKLNEIQRRKAGVDELWTFESTSRISTFLSGKAWRD